MKIFIVALLDVLLDFLRFPRNLAYWFLGLFLLPRLKYKDNWNWKKYALLYFLDVGVNVIFLGGDPGSPGNYPGETISSRFQKDRNAWLPGLVMRLIEKIDAHHGRNAVTYQVGEGSLVNRELSKYGSFLLWACWLALIFYHQFLS